LEEILELKKKNRKLEHFQAAMIEAIKEYDK